MHSQFSISEITDFLQELFPICRSITGRGTRKTLDFVKKILPGLSVKNIQAGTQVFDWTVPPEWNVRDAYVKNSAGEKIIDFQKNNLHLMSYSIPYKGVLSRDELMKHIHSLPQKPSWIPYRTSYYERNWGFCCEHTLLVSDAFKGPFEVFIDSMLDENGSLVYGEAFKEGDLEEEILISTYCCHPSLANDNLSGLITAVLLFKYLEDIKTKYSYRLAIVPETIGALCFLKNHHRLDTVIGGTVITTVAGPDKYSIKEAFNKDHWINKVTHLVVSNATNGDYITYPFVPYGSDERQYSTPGFRIPTPSIHKSKYSEYDEYHTSADNLEFISAKNLAETLNIYYEWIKAVDSRCHPVRKEMFGEFQLGRRGLYPIVGGSVNQKAHGESPHGYYGRHRYFDKNIRIHGHHVNCFYWLMHLCDGKHSNFDIADRSGIPLHIVNEAITLFVQEGLIEL